MKTRSRIPSANVSVWLRLLGLFVGGLGLVFAALMATWLLAAPTHAQEDLECGSPQGWKPTKAEMKTILQDHAKWIEQGGQLNASIQGKANLCNADLGKADLSGADLRAANLANANLTEARLPKSNLYDANLSSANLVRTDLTDASLNGANLSGANLYATKLDGADLLLANLEGVYTDNYAGFIFCTFGNCPSFQGSELTRVNLRNAYLGSANMEGAVLTEANLAGSNLRGAKLKDALLLRTNLTETDLREADLSGATLLDTQVDNAKLSFGILSGAFYQASGSPSPGHVVQLRGLQTVWFNPGNQSGLVQLRAVLMQAGLRDLERKATFVIESGITRHAIGNWSEDPKSVPEGILRLVFFEWTTGWGLYYGRPILILLTLIGIMTLVYIPPLAMNNAKGKDSGIYRIWPKGRFERSQAGFETVDDEKVERLQKGGLPLFGYALYFSALSAFHIGWRELNVGSWLTRLQSREYALRGRGWVRVVSGAQSLVSVYLLAMWALTYFGRPFG